MKKHNELSLSHHGNDVVLKSFLGGAVDIGKRIIVKRPSWLIAEVGKYSSDLKTYFASNRQCFCK